MHCWGIWGRAKWWPCTRRGYVWGHGGARPASALSPSHHRSGAGQTPTYTQPQLPPFSPCQKALLHRLIFVARISPELVDKRELAGYWDRLFQSLQCYYQGEAVTGLLLLYPSCMAHVLEASSDVLFSVLRDLRDLRQQGHRPLVLDPKILVLSHNIPSRLFREWSYKVLSVSVRPSDDSTEPLEGVASECLATLLRLGMLLLKCPESPPHLLDNLVEQVPELLGFEATVGHLLACHELQSPEQFLQAYDTPLHPGLDAARVWPVSEHMALPSMAWEQAGPAGTAA
ncbi:testis-expressed protein 47-like isoform X1 [Struthio camelus]|uniref:testis-expressed protein 47-like isoform X1 n=1 Tax=Struthio camelus TaxID=8801 RepID=UPI00360405E5